MVINGVQGVIVMATHPNKFVLMTLARYLVSTRNDGIPTILVENNYFYNRVQHNMLKL
jgi:putative ribosome biogenesis GTPase RsgA